MIALRPYQQEAVTAIIRGFGEFDRQLAVMPTAAGKTIVFAILAQHILPGKTLVLVTERSSSPRPKTRSWQQLALWPRSRRPAK